MRWALLLVVSGCFAPSPPQGIACGDDTVCPSSLKCSMGKCVSSTLPDDDASQPATCIPIEDGAGALVIPKLAAAPTVDGDLSDWPTCFVTVDLSTAGLVRDLGAGGKFAPGRFSIGAFDTRVYVVAEVQSVLPLGNAMPPDVYLNNAISVYFDGDGTFLAARYDDDAAQIVVDHANRTAAFQSANGGVIPIPEQLNAARTTATTFTIELSITPRSLGLSAFASTIGFDIGLVGGDGQVMTSELVWFQACDAPECGCPDNPGQVAPFCDAREFGTARFLNN